MSNVTKTCPNCGTNYPGVHICGAGTPIERDRALIAYGRKQGRVEVLAEVEKVAEWLGNEPDLNHGHALDAWRELTDIVRRFRDGLS